MLLPTVSETFADMSQASRLGRLRTTLLRNPSSATWRRYLATSPALANHLNYQARLMENLDFKPSLKKEISSNVCTFFYVNF